MATKRFCDICGKEITTAATFGPVWLISDVPLETAKIGLGERCEPCQAALAVVIRQKWGGLVAAVRRRVSELSGQESLALTPAPVDPVALAGSLAYQGTPATIAPER